MTQIIILGLKHSGKSTLGKRLAQHLRLDFFDGDSLLVAWYDRQSQRDPDGYPARKITLPPEAGTNVPRQITLAHGLEGFRKYEAETIKDFLTRQSPWVLSLGGAAASNPEAAALLRESPALRVFLDVPEALLFERIRSGGLPPFLEANSLEESAKLWHTMYIHRQQDAIGLADIRITLGALDLDQAFKRLRSAVEEYIDARE